MPKREYDGDPLDQTWQDIKDRPYKGPGETVAATEPETGRERTEGIDSALGRLKQDTLFNDIDDWIERVRDWDFDWRQSLACDDSLPKLVRLVIFSSILADMCEYGARVDQDRWLESARELSVDQLRLNGDFPYDERQYIGDPKLHEAYEEFLFDIIPEKAPDPLNAPVA